MGIAVVAVAGLGLAFSVIEHTRPLRTLTTEAERLAKGEIDTLQVSKFRGVYRKIASDLNDGTDKVAAKGGAPRKAADLESVLGPIPAKPEMSAFSFPMEGSRVVSSPGSGPRSQPKMPPPSVPPSLAGPVGMPQPQALKPSPVQMPVPVGIKLPPPKPALGPPMPEPPPTDLSQSASEGDDDATVVSAVPPEILEASATGGHRAVKEADEIAEWHNTFEEFVRTKKQCNEATAGLTFEKFQNTLRKNRDQLISKTGCKRVRFNVYVKDGRAALKASPVRG
jgi:hypothetical protein